ncbi:MAG: TetR/AcrR family transcriptional regulator [Methanomethylophilus sp.]
MPLNRKPDLRVVKTKKAIKTAFKEMICEMDASQITVKDLANRAMIHRKTFYLHYTSIEALFEDITQELADDYYCEIDKLPPDAPFTEVNRVFFTFMAHQEPYMQKAVCSESYRGFIGRLFLSMEQHNRTKHNPYAQFSPDEQDIINNFLCIGSINLYRQWILDEKRLPLDRLIELSGQLFTHGVASLVNVSTDLVFNRPAAND